MKVLLISNTYIESTLLNVLDDLLPYEITQIILLEENHIKNDMIKCTHEILICPNLDEGIKQCEIVLLVKHPEMNLLLEDTIISYCNRYKRKYLIIESLSNIPIHQRDNTEIETIKCNNAPVICLVAIGDFAQHLCIEFILNRIFKKIGVNVQQIYSIEAKNLLRQLSPQTESDEKNRDHYEVVIQSIIHNNVNDVLQNAELLKIFEATKPDFTIVNIESGLTEKCDVESIIKSMEIRYNTKIDMVVSSSYCSIKDNKNSYMPMYYNKKTSDTFYSIEDIELENIIKQKIMTKITLPNDVELL